MSQQTPLIVPSLSLVVLVGASGSGESTCARAECEPCVDLWSDL